MTVYNLANGDITKYEEVFEQPWAYVQMTRRINLKLYKINQRIKANRK